MNQQNVTLKMPTQKHVTALSVGYPQVLTELWRRLRCNSHRATKNGTSNASPLPFPTPANDGSTNLHSQKIQYLGLLPRKDQAPHRVPFHPSSLVHILWLWLTRSKCPINPSCKCSAGVPSSRVSRVSLNSVQLHAIFSHTMVKLQKVKLTELQGYFKDYWP